MAHPLSAPWSDGANVVKNSVRTAMKANASLVLPDVAATATDLEGAPLFFVVSLGVFFRLDGADTTTPANGSTVLVTTTGARYKQLGRERLTAVRTYYVRPDGNNNNDGRANTAGGAFLTLAKAWDVVSSVLDQNGFKVTIQLADATWTVGFAPTVAPTGPVEIKGNTTTPSSCLLSLASGNVFNFTVPGTVVTLNGMKLATSASSGTCIVAGGPNIDVAYQNIEFDVAQYHVYANRAQCRQAGPCTITGGATVHAFATEAGQIRTSSQTITVAAAVAITYFAYVTHLGYMLANAMTFVNPANVTGTRYQALINGVVNTAGGGANYLPGTIAGAVSNGGVYA